MRQKPIPPFGPPAVCAVCLLASALAARAITTGELQAALTNQTKIMVIDVRGTDLFAQGHIPGAINIPASLCPLKNLPPLGRVVVCAGGLGRDAAEAAAAAALAAKPGITVEILEGGFAAWESARGPTTKPGGLRPETLNYIAYADLKAAKADEVVLVDLRDSPAAAKLGAKDAVRPPLTDLAAEFPGMKVARSPSGALVSRGETLPGSGAPPLLVLIDSGNGKSEAAARAFKVGGARRYVILAGGETILARQGRPGLERVGASHPPTQNQAPGGGR